ncbi:transposase, MuDR, MULE transposase domain protein [Tanacetum coccineum]
MDGNNQIVPIAFGICKGETCPCWSWWMSVLKECIGDNPNLLFISDRHAAIALQVEKGFPLVSMLVESVNACSVIYRKEPVLKLAETYRAMVQEWYYKRRQLADWQTTNVGKKKMKSATWVVKGVNAYQYEVSDGMKQIKNDYHINVMYDFAKVAGKLQIFVSHTQIDLSTLLIPNDGSLEESFAAQYKLEIYIEHIGVDFVISKYIFPNASLAEMMNHVITDYSSENEGIIRHETQNDYTFNKMVEWAEQEHFEYEETKTSHTISPISTMLSSTIESCLSYTHFFSPLTYYMAYGANEARQAIVLKLQREIQAEETLADQLLCNLTRYTEEMQALDEEAILEEQMLALMHRFADRFTDRRVEINNLMVLHNHPLIDYGKYALGCMTGADMKKCVKLKGVRDELLRSMEEKRQLMANYRSM